MLPKSMFIGAVIAMALALTCYGLKPLFYRGVSYKYLIIDLKIKIFAVGMWGIFGALIGLLAGLLFGLMAHVIVN